MATLAELRTALARDIRDPDKITIKDPELTDLLNMGIDEVGRVYPQEKVYSLTPVANTYEYDLTAQAFVHVFRVEWLRSSLFYADIEPSSGAGALDGWEFFNFRLYFPLPAVTGSQVVPATDYFRVWGYASRARLLTDAQVAELDTSAEFAVRAFAKARVFEMLHSDRALFKQWQAASQNADTSPNQLSQMVTLYTGEWERQRNHLRRLRRV